MIVVAAIGAGAAWKSGLFTKKQVVPSLIGLTLTQASTALKGDGFTVTVSQQVHSSSVAANKIVSQSPLADSSAKSGQVITVSVSEGPVLVTMPTNLLGETCVAATAQLSALHVIAQCPSSAAIYSSTITLNDVARVLYKKSVNPTSVPREATVVLSLSKGSAVGTTTTTTTTTPTSGTTTTTTTTVAGEGLRAVPSLVGDDQAQVYAAMHLAKLYFTTTGPNSNSTKWTTVVSENPVAGTMVAWHSYVTFTVR